MEELYSLLNTQYSSPLPIVLQLTVFSSHSKRQNIKKEKATVQR